ncbi:glycosyltransferase, partial [Gemmatimonadota bacterium]
GSDGDYLLYPATAHPHKNHLTLIEGFRSADMPEGWRLLMVGAVPGRNGRRVLDACDGLKTVHFGQVPKARLVELYRGARGVVIPSLFEGYGLPLEEAIRLGVPVLCNDLTVFREIAPGGDVTFFDARAVETTREALEVFAGEVRVANLQTREGDEERRSWTAVAEETLNVLRSIAPTKS